MWRADGLTAFYWTKMGGSGRKEEIILGNWEEKLRRTNSSSILESRVVRLVLELSLILRWEILGNFMDGDGTNI